MIFEFDKSFSKSLDKINDKPLLFVFFSVELKIQQSGFFTEFIRDFITYPKLQFNL
jgi:hypothetical protein